MELRSPKNKSVYNVPDEMFPDRAEYLEYAGEYWARRDKLSEHDLEDLRPGEDEEWVPLPGADRVPAGASVNRLSGADVGFGAAPSEEDGEEVELTDEERAGLELVKGGDKRIPGIVDASSQEHVDLSQGGRVTDPGSVRDDEKHREEDDGDATSGAVARQGEGRSEDR